MRSSDWSSDVCSSDLRRRRGPGEPLMSTVATDTAVVFIDDVHAGYLPGVNILNGCSLTAYQGELIGIIGPNGAGKSTLLKAIFGQVNVRSGRVLLEGEDITGLRANKLVGRGVGFIPQTNNVFRSEARRVGNE